MWMMTHAGTCQWTELQGGVAVIASFVAPVLFLVVGKAHDQEYTEQQSTWWSVPCLAMAAHLPLVVASSSAGALPVCGLHSCWGFPRQSNVLAPTKAVWGRRRRRRRCRRSCCCERNHPMRHVAQSQCAKVGRGHGLVCAGGGCSDSGTGTGAYSTRAQWWFQIYIYIHI